MKVDVAEVARQRAEMEQHLQRVRETVAEIDSIGVQVKDLDSGLLDFPCRVDDEVVLLCWRMGESAIEHWHTVEADFRAVSRSTSVFPAAPLPVAGRTDASLSAPCRRYSNPSAGSGFGGSRVNFRRFQAAAAGLAIS